MSHSNTPPVRNAQSSCLIKVCIGSRAPHCWTELQNGHNKTQKASSTKRSIVEYSTGLPQDTKSLRNCSGNRPKMLLKGRLGIKCHSQYGNISMSSDSFSTVPPIVNGSDWGCIARDLETIIILILLAFNFISQRSHHSLTPPKSRIRDYAL